MKGYKMSSKMLTVKAVYLLIVYSFGFGLMLLLRDYIPPILQIATGLAAISTGVFLSLVIVLAAYKDSEQ